MNRNSPSPKIRSRSIGLLTALLATQLLSACVVVPVPHRPYYRPRVVVEVSNGHPYPVHPAPPYPGYHRGHRW